MTGYKIITNDSEETVEASVTMFIKSGWKLHGSLIVTFEPECSLYRQRLVFTQALVKDKT